MDVLADLLSRARARGAAFASTTVHGTEWGLRFADPARLAVHVILQGAAFVLVGRRAVPVRAGDVVAVRTAGAHSLVGHQQASLVDLPKFLAHTGIRRSDLVYERDGDGPSTTFVCGAYRFDGDLCSTLLGSLPEVIVVPAPPGSSLSALVGLLSTEIGGASPGRQTVLDRLLDVLLISVLRAHFSADPSAAPTWFAALDDRAVGTALRAMHDDPAAPLTIAALARLAHVSRATLAQRFTGLVGVPPSTYLTSWRLQLAKEQLRETDDSLQAIAHQVGYGSGYALAAAFKRETGVAPGAWRVSQRAVPLSV